MHIFAILIAVLIAKLAYDFLKTRVAWNNFRVDSASGFLREHLRSKWRVNILIFPILLFAMVAYHVSSYLIIASFYFNYDTIAKDAGKCLASSLSLSVLFFLFSKTALIWRDSKAVIFECGFLKRTIEFHLRKGQNFPSKSFRGVVGEITSISNEIFKKTTVFKLESPVLCDQRGCEKVRLTKFIVTSLESQGFVVTKRVKKLSLFVSLAMIIELHKRPNSRNAVKIIWHKKTDATGR